MITDDDRFQIEKSGILSEEEHASKKILFDSVSTHFSISVFLNQFLVHILFPLLVPLEIWKYGWLSMYTHEFEPSFQNVFSYVFGTAPAVLFVCCYFKHSLIYQAAFPISLLIMHRMMIALKYATLSASELRYFSTLFHIILTLAHSRRIMRGSNISKSDSDHFSFPSPGEIELVRAYQRQLQILTGWYFLARNRISFEIGAAATLAGIHASYSFHVPHYSESEHCKLQFNRWKSFLTATDMLAALAVDSDCGAYKVDLLYFCEAIMRESNKMYFGWLRYVLLLLSLLNASIPLFYVKSFAELDQWEIVYHIVSFLLNLSMYFAVSSFLWVAVLETLRRNAVSQMLADILRTVDIDTNIKVRLTAGSVAGEISRERIEVTNVLRRQTFKTKQEQWQGQGQVQGQSLGGRSESSASASVEMRSTSVSDTNDPTGDSGQNTDRVVLPQLDPTFADNFVMWMHCRSLLNALGRRPRFRLDIYTGGVILLIFSLLIILVLMMIRAEKREDVIKSAPFFQIVLWIIVFTSFQAVIVMMGHLTNKTRESHRYMISQHILHTQSKIDKISVNRLNRMRKGISASADFNAGDTAEELDRMVLHDTLSAATITLHAVEAMDTVEPERVLGIKAQGRTAVVMMYSLFLFIIAILQYIAYGTVASSSGF